MGNFMLQFLICNIFICVMIGILLAAKRLFKNSLTNRMQYNLWFLLFGLLLIPFIPIKPIAFLPIFSLFGDFKNLSFPVGGNINEITSPKLSNSLNWMNDFSLSTSHDTSSFAGLILCAIWIVGIIVMIVLAIKSKIHLNILKKSSLPLQNEEVHKLYYNCILEMKIKKVPPIYSTAFLKSPVIVGLFKPCIYLPIHLISDYNATDIRYMLLHELQHYKHRDTSVNYLMNLFGILYWFNPFVWYSLKEMRSDREVACDSSVLEMLGENAYKDYGNTLINFVEKVSFTSFPFAAGIGSNIKQMRQRIINIASYKKPSVWKRLKSLSVFVIIGMILLSLTPTLSTYASVKNRYHWDSSSEDISYTDFSTYFDGYEGSFVLYDLENASWNIYNRNHATRQVSPNSTYKIYDALFGLEEGVITPKDSFIAWDKKEYPFDAWNTNQNLQSAMQASVNWYFQSIDKQLGATSISNYIRNIGYGNENIGKNLSSYWMESSLKISSIEQVKLLKDMYSNHFKFSPKNINAVKDALFLSSSKNGTLHGKTGTGSVNGQDINGWFIGYVENGGNTYFFAVNIIADTKATGSNASKIALSILSDLKIWKE